MAGVTGLEPAASGVTGQRSHRLSYTPAVGVALEVDKRRARVKSTGPRVRLGPTPLTFARAERA